MTNSIHRSSTDAAAAAAAAEIEMTQNPQATPLDGSDHHDPADIDLEHETSDSRPLLRESSDNGEQIKEDLRIDYEKPSSKRRSFWKQPSLARNVLIAASLVIFAGTSLTAFLLLRNEAKRQQAQIGPHWQGFSHIEHWFAFGDSWTDTKFKPWEEQPSTKNPLGNPPFPGETSSNGLNYVGYLATQHNHSFIKVYDMAFSGSTVDAHYDHPMLDWLDFLHQVKDRFIHFYTKNDTGVVKPLGWTAENTLISTFFGINDVVVFDRTHPQLPKVFETYITLIGQVYDAGARNFLIMNVPPLDRAPITGDKTAAQRIEYGKDVVNFNNRIKDMVRHLRTQYSDITIFEYDVHGLFEQILVNPKSIPETTSYVETLESCPEYKLLEYGVVPTKEQVEACHGLGVEQYLWLNLLHVSWPAHDAIAAGIEKLLLSAGFG